MSKPGVRAGMNTVKRRDYKIGPRNSTVCGSPGREYDWSLFCWDGSAVFLDTHHNPPSESRATEPWTDNVLIADDCEYLHVPYNWAESRTTFRVRPNESMYAGRTYRGYRVDRQRAVKKEDGWYWRLETQE